MALRDHTLEGGGQFPLEFLAEEGAVVVGTDIVLVVIVVVAEVKGLVVREVSKFAVRPVGNPRLVLEGCGGNAGKLKGEG